MNNIIISTDATSDLEQDFVDQHNIKICPMNFILDGKDYLTTDNVSMPEFYQAMKDGKSTSTSQVNLDRAEKYIHDLLEGDSEIIHISMSSGLSGTYNNFVTVYNQLSKPDQARIKIIDSLSGCCGEALLVRLAVNKVSAGATLEEVYTALNDIKDRLASFFTLSDLKYLLRGGRISKVTALIGSILNIKPIIRANDQGKLVSHQKVINRKKALAALAQHVVNTYSGECDILYVAHADAPDEAKTIADSIASQLSIQPIVAPIGHVMSSHCGPGCIAVFYISKHSKKA